ncbi:MAG: aminodeoxychorismate/anthranilate synthase component II [Planctomycetes bacterium]|nr:aminodeoxychorismate/anthranilate synthase component II [Planctomycetota bacterium]
MLVIIDNYDSFTYNLVQQIGMLFPRRTVRVIRNDAMTAAEIAALGPRRVIISPGPCTPRQAGISVELIKRLCGRVPLLGVCLGHQCIAEAFGGRVVGAGRLMHGRTSPIHHTGTGHYAGVPNPFTAARYHSLIVDALTLPPELAATAWTEEGELMGIRHRTLPVEGVQFHPESFLTPEGGKLMANFLRERAPTGRIGQGRRAAAAPCVRSPERPAGARRA